MFGCPAYVLLAASLLQHGNWTTSADPPYTAARNGDSRSCEDRKPLLPSNQSSSSDMVQSFSVMCSLEFSQRNLRTGAENDMGAIGPRMVLQAIADIIAWQWTSLSCKFGNFSLLRSTNSNLRAL